MYNDIFLSACIISFLFSLLMLYMAHINKDECKTDFENIDVYIKTGNYQIVSKVKEKIKRQQDNAITFNFLGAGLIFFSFICLLIYFLL